MRTEPVSTLLVDVTLADGHRTNVLLNHGVVEAIGELDPDVHAGPTTDVVALSGYLLLPAPVETHAHLDKALLADRFPNPTMDLPGAIVAIRQAYASMTPDDIEDRATRAALMAVARGCTTIRTHVDCGSDIGTRGVEGVVRARSALRGLVDIQIVALAGFPVSGAAGAANRQALRAALAAGADIIGGAPALDVNPAAAVSHLLALAIETNRGIDLHVDETTDPHVTSLASLAGLVRATGFSHPVAASHCVSLGMQTPDRARRIAHVVAEAGISVITLPQTNLYLQGRDSVTNIPRALTAIGELRRAGVTVAGGSDNWRDPFNPMGRADPLETANLLVIAGHLSPRQAYAAVSDDARAALGVPVTRIEPGFAADLLAIRAANLAEALATGTEDRVVFKAGVAVARTRVTREQIGCPTTAPTVAPPSSRRVRRATPTG